MITDIFIFISTSVSEQFSPDLHKRPGPGLLLLVVHRLGRQRHPPLEGLLVLQRPQPQPPVSNVGK